MKRKTWNSVSESFTWSKNDPLSLELVHNLEFKLFSGITLFISRKLLLYTLCWTVMQVSISSLLFYVVLRVNVVNKHKASVKIITFSKDSHTNSNVTCIVI